MTTLSGHCLCGGVRVRFQGDVLNANHCHCESCRRATSSPVTSFFTGRQADTLLEGESLAFYASSPGVRRGFCSKCGSPMSYETETRPEQIDLYLACLDDLKDLVIAGHWYWSERVPWLSVVDDLPKHK